MILSLVGMISFYPIYTCAARDPVERVEQFRLLLRRFF
tara:strand:+ start:813 stop:926 length:114 start_codon:yes stop_codon:yes gene_type:complete